MAQSFFFPACQQAGSFCYFYITFSSKRFVCHKNIANPMSRIFIIIFLGPTFLHFNRCLSLFTLSTVLVICPYKLLDVKHCMVVYRFPILFPYWQQNHCFFQAVLPNLSFFRVLIRFFSIHHEPLHGK